MTRQSKTKAEKTENYLHKIGEPYEIRKSVSLESVADSGFGSSRSQSLESVRSCREDFKVEKFQNFKKQSRDAKKFPPEADKNGELNKI